MLLAAVWLAILFATKLTEPIGGLMSAAEQMRGGNLAVRVEEGPPNDELGQLARSFTAWPARSSSSAASWSLPTRNSILAAG